MTTIALKSELFEELTYMSWFKKLLSVSDQDDRSVISKENTSPDHALWVKFDGIDAQEADDLLKANIDAKSKIAPHARCTFAKGTRTELPNRISEALRLQEDKKK